MGRHEFGGVAGRARRRARRWWAGAAALLLLSVGLFSVGLHPADTAAAPPAVRVLPLPSVADAPATTPTPTPPPPSTQPTSSGLPPAGSAASSAPTPGGPVAVGLARSVPTRLRVPAIGLDVSLSELGLNPDGTVEVPTDFAQPGWFGLGPSPGQVGSAVILGHVDSYQGPAAFYDLEALRPGDSVEVTLANGAVAEFVVDSLASYLKTEFPAEQVYGSHGYSGLQLVTCGGDFDYQTRHYLSNTVVSTSLVTPSAP